METSAKTAVCVNEIFVAVAKRLPKVVGPKPPVVSNDNVVKVEKTTTTGKTSNDNKTGCCT
jgi:hypothetical protein